MNNIVRLACSASLALLLSACATTAPQKDTRRYFWPQLPERPRIEWLKSYVSEDDFDEGGSKKFLAALAGEDAQILLDRPLDIVGNSRGVIYIAEPAQKNVTVFDFPSKKVYRLLPESAKKSEFEQPISVTVDESDNLYVGDILKKKIMVYDKQHAPKFTIDLEPNVSSVGGITIDRKNKRIVVADTRAHKICFLDLDGKFRNCVGDRGDKDGFFNYPGPVKFNKKGELVVGDTMNARIQILDEEGKFLRKFGNRGDGPQDLQVLKGLDMDSEGHIYVTDGKAHKVVIFSDTGDFLLTIGGKFAANVSGKEAQGGFLVPQGIYFAPDDRFYVVDQLNRRFQVFQYMSDAFLLKNPIPGYVPPVDAKMGDQDGALKK